MLRDSTLIELMVCVWKMHVNEHGKVDRITKVWHSAWAAAQVGWIPDTTEPADAEHLFAARD